MKKLPEILSVLVLAAAFCAAQPVLRPTDPVVNGASYANTIAPGSIFVVFGTNLAGDGVVQATAPLQATPLGGVSIRFTSVGDGSTVDALMVYTTKNQVAGLLPSSAAPGDYDVRVTYNNQTSAPGRATVVARSFGIVSADSSGSGQAQAQDYRSDTEWDLNRYAKGTLGNLTTSPAGPGHVIVVWGTGLGADLASDNGGTSGDRKDSAQVKVIVGNKEITPVFAGRASGLPGTDQVNFTLPPDTDTGCSVPVQVRAGATVSNTVTLAIVSGSQEVCQHPLLSADVLRRLSAGGTTVLGSFALTKQDVTISLEGLPLLGDSIEAIGGSFARHGVGNLSQFGVSPSPVGTCQVLKLRGTVDDVLLGLTSAPASAAGLDAGERLTLNGPNANDIAVPRVEKNSYSKILIAPSLFGSPGGGLAVIAAGTYTLTGPGGAEIGPFNAEVTVPAPIEWTNSKDISTVTRNQPLNVTWTGGSSGNVVRITGVSASMVPGTSDNPIYDASIFVCNANAGAGSFSVSSSILSQLPPVTLEIASLASIRSIGLLGIQLSNPASSGTFSAPLTAGGSIDYGSFGFLVGVNKTVDYR